MKPNGYLQYKAVLHHHHRNRAARAYFDLYAWFWFHTEVWLRPIDRRPYTYIMRDWIFPHKSWFYIIEAIFNATTLALILLIDAHVPQAFLSIFWVFSGWLSAHLIWGAKWISGQQEWPPYLG
jgi:hypothetical protein